MLINEAWAQAAAPAGGDLMSMLPILLMFIVLYFLSMMFAQFSSFSVVGIWVLGFLMLMLTPVVVSLIFSLWTATRPSILVKP